MLYTNYNQLLKQQFGARVQKISINAGFTCPNRDGKLGIGGCTFCNNQTFYPEYCKPTKSVRQQMIEGIEFFKRYKGQVYLAYFQAYTNTYASIDVLKEMYAQVLDIPYVKGIVVATRPDCVTGEMLDFYAELAKQYYVMIEYGVESTNDGTLAVINRGHDYAQSVWAIRQTAERNIRTGAHIILGLPGESRFDMLAHADNLNKLPLDMLKLHQLQVVKGTKLAEQWRVDPDFIHLFTIEEYLELCIDFLLRLSPHIAIERFVSQSPADMLLAPNWGVKNYEFVAQLEKRIVARLKMGK